MHNKEKARGGLKVCELTMICDVCTLANCPRRHFVQIHILTQEVMGILYVPFLFFFFLVGVGWEGVLFTNHLVQMHVNVSLFLNYLRWYK